MRRITHLTSAHSRFDTRIFHKMCSSLVRNGYDVSLVVADSNGDENRNGVKIHDVGKPKGRFERARNTSRRVLLQAVPLNADLYHLHDPELIPIGLDLKRLGKKVIFDFHEDVPKQLLGKSYFNPLVLRLLSFGFAQYERFVCSRFDAIITATPFIRDKFLKINPRTVDINNYPILGELEQFNQVANERSTACYVGGVEAIRGIREMVRAMERVRSDIRLEIAGSFSEPALGKEVGQYLGWEKVDELGFIDRAGVREVLSRSLMGLVTLHPLINYIDALPVKMFEYMSAGVPVIASNFPLWREIIEDNGCGLCVDPLDPQAIAVAIDTLAQDPVRARKMGQKGKRAVQQHYNWGVEEKKLLGLYENLLKDHP
ncbi:glycosyltransferase family 4 protein [Akkermansiaceae bacterium]|nr:glycosyltransferase family 4 protein [Akkermansiaceae bacterium]